MDSWDVQNRVVTATMLHQVTQVLFQSPRVIYPPVSFNTCFADDGIGRIPIIAKTNTKPSERVNETFNPLRIPTSRSSLCQIQDLKI
ncbi:MAG: hypothetical protein CM15mP49_20250 [Actinomycetota bacterium]|nr:MAG: hypothetical protein CM15mP49_20250 [Actinomycetota bacterium]